MNKLKQEYEQAVITLMNLQESEDFEVNITDRTIAGLMLCKRLDRIADAIEAANDTMDSISSSLSEISISLDSLDKTLSGCTYTNGKNDFLCITGNVTTN